MKTANVAIVGAGIAGASLAAALAPHCSVILLEAEDQPGYHATGRSAAFWSATYGGAEVARLSAASFGWLDAHGFLSARGELFIGRDGDAAALDSYVAGYPGIGFERLSGADLDAILPGRRPDWTHGVWQPDCRDIDVAALHAHYLAAAKRGGAELLCRAAVEAASFDKSWRIETRMGSILAAVLVDAAGAWADELAIRAGVKPVGIAPLRRTIAQIRVAADVPATLPLVMDIGESCYFKPDNGRVWLSPNDETPTAACDAAPEELDIAIAIDAFETIMGWPVAAVERRWAGLRSFSPDRLPVYGFAPDAPAFYWIAGQGGFGIQTAPAAAAIAAGQILGKTPDPMVAGIHPARFDPSRFSA